MIHLFATAIGTNDSIATAIILTMGTIIVAILTLIGIVIKNGKDVRIVRNKVTSNIEDVRHRQNIQKFRNLQLGQSDQNRRLIRIEDNLGIEHTIVPNRKKTK